jgi:hypothetical protein
MRPFAIVVTGEVPEDGDWKSPLITAVERAVMGVREATLFSLQMRVGEPGEEIRPRPAQGTRDGHE